MKKLIAILLLLALVGCTSSTEYGQCVGAFDNRDPNLTYKLSVWNAVLAVFFVETIFVPVVVIANETVCPESRRDQRKDIP